MFRISTFTTLGGNTLVTYFLDIFFTTDSDHTIDCKTNIRPKLPTSFIIKTFTKRKIKIYKEEDNEAKSNRNIYKNFQSFQGQLKNNMKPLLYMHIENEII